MGMDQYKQADLNYYPNGLFPCLLWTLQEVRLRVKVATVFYGFP